MGQLDFGLIALHGEFGIALRRGIPLLNCSRIGETPRLADSLLQQVNPQPFFSSSGSRARAVLIETKM